MVAESWAKVADTAMSIAADAKHDIDSTIVRKTKNFDLPLQKKRNGTYKIPSGTKMYTCFTSDFFVEDADEWRSEAWDMIRDRNDFPNKNLIFNLIYKKQQPQ